MGNLMMAQFQRAKLNEAQFQEAMLDMANLTAEQLLTAKSIEDATLDPDLRAEYDRLKAEEDAMKPKA